MDDTGDDGGDVDAIGDLDMEVDDQFIFLDADRDAFALVPRFPPPVLVCWMIAACGMLATVCLVLTALRVEEYRRRRPDASASGDILKF